MSNDQSQTIDDLLEAAMETESPSKKPKNKNRPNRDGVERSQLRNTPATVRMGDTFRIPWVHRVKQAVLKAQWILPIYAIYMTAAAWYNWEMGTKTAIFAVIAFGCHAIVHVIIGFIDPEDWQGVKKKVQSKTTDELIRNGL